MTGFLLLIRNIAPGLYFLCLIGFIWGMWNFAVARGKLAVAQFTLEREDAEEQGGRGLTYIFVSLELAALIWLFSGTVYDAWKDIQLGSPDEDTVAPSVYLTSTPGAVGEGLTVPTLTPDALIIPRTPAPTATPPGTLLPASERLGCTYGQANIVIPANGQVIYETTPIRGTANIENFGSYRFEIKNIEMDANFGVIGDTQSNNFVPVSEPAGPLGQLVPQNWIPGEYRFRLVVFDSSDMLRASCEITIFITEPLPTSTPIGAGASGN